MKLKDLLTITKEYVQTNTKAYRESKKGGNAKAVAVDFAKFCKKKGIDCKVIEGTFRLDKKQENGSKEVEHYWNVIGDGMFGDGSEGTYADKTNPLNTNPLNTKKYPMLTDFSVKPTYEDTGLATDNSKDRYKAHKELPL